MKGESKYRRELREQREHQKSVRDKKAAALKTKQERLIKLAARNAGSDEVLTRRVAWQHAHSKPGYLPPLSTGSNLAGGVE